MPNPVHPISIGSVNLEGNVFLAPLAGYTDKIYRSICLKHGANLAFTEMVSSEGVARDSANTVTLMDRGENEKNLAVQLFAPDAETVKRSVEKTMKAGPAIIDFNCGCPVPKVIKTGAGSALLKKTDEIYRIVKVLVTEAGIPITVKIRTGWDLNSVNYLETAQAVFDAGASALCMHARTRSQLYTPYADWNTLKDLKSHFQDKVIIGSGDLFSAEDGIRMLTQTGVDAISFARGAIGNPFVFEQVKALSDGKECLEFTPEEKVETIVEHLEGLVKYKGEATACREMRKHVCAYLKGLKNSSKVKQLISSAVTIENYKEALSLVGSPELVHQNSGSN